MRNKKLFGFTLAEVLITLAIIGVVAALTMPTLMSNYRKHEVETRLVKFYSTINQAIRMSEATNGDIKHWESYTGPSDNKCETNNAKGWFEKYLAPYMAISKIEQGNSYEKPGLVYFNDGSLMEFAACYWNFYPHAKDYAEMEKEDGSIDRNRADSGKKWLSFNLYRNLGGVYPYGKNEDNTLTDDTLKNHSSIGCTKEPPSNERAYCTLLIERNNWKIPNDYPLKF